MDEPSPHPDSSVMAPRNSTLSSEYPNTTTSPAASAAAHCSFVISSPYSRPLSCVASCSFVISLVFHSNKSPEPTPIGCRWLSLWVSGCCEPWLRGGSVRIVRRRSVSLELLHQFFGFEAEPCSTVHRYIPAPPDAFMP